MSRLPGRMDQIPGRLMHLLRPHFRLLKTKGFTTNLQEIEATGTTHVLNLTTGFVLLAGAKHG